MPVNASKRLYTQVTSDCVNEQVQVHTVVVIHPGSLNLRIGRASDTFPVTVKHCVARRKKTPGAASHKTPWMLRHENKHAGNKQHREKGLKAANDALEDKPMDSGEYRPPSSVKQLYTNNIRVKGEKTDVLCPQKWTNVDKKPEYIVGDEALLIKSDTDYSIHWPMHRGHLNLHDDAGGTLTAVLADMELIWGHVLESLLDIPLKDLKYYRAVLLVPDVYDHKQVRDMMSVLLDRLGFGAAIVHQESVCGAFGAGVPSGCIVDVGDQKTSISCIEDGISHRHTRVSMEIGGSDITRMFLELLNRLGFNPKVDLSSYSDAMLLQDLKEDLCHLDHKSLTLLMPKLYIKVSIEIGGSDITRMFLELLNRLGFNPKVDLSSYSDAMLLQDLKEDLCHLDHESLTLLMPKLYIKVSMEIGGSDITRMFLELLNRLGFNPKVDLSSYSDAMLLQDLKEDLCHLDHNRYGYLEESVQIKRPGHHISKYFIQIGDELVLAPLSLFFPDMHGLQGDQLTHIQKRNEGDPSDPHDEFYLRQVQRGQDPASKLAKKKDNAEVTREGPDMSMDDSALAALQDDDSNDMPDTMAMTDACKSSRRPDMEEEMEEEESEDVAPPLMKLDDAILYSISKCDSDEIKKKMYSCIVVVGGGLNFEGTQPWLQYCIWKNMPAYYRPMLETMDVITRPKELDPQIVCWKGAAILACLDTTQELWIRKKEWKQFDVRMLRERAPFVW